MEEKGKCLPEIWVYCEMDENGLARSSRELLGKAHSLAKEADCTVTAVLFEKAGGEHAAQSAISYGADIAYRFLSPYNMDGMVQARAIAGKLGEERPWAFLFPATANVRMIAAALSVRLRTGLTADCTALSVEVGFLKQTRPAFGGKLMAEVFCCRTFPQMATVRSGVFPLPHTAGGRSGEIRTVVLGEEMECMPKVREQRENKGERLTEAQIVLAGGIGLQTAEGFRLLEETARAIGAVPAASRAAVNAGLAPYAWQVGQSGRAIRPKFYIACGISGAVQHMAGVQGAGTIVAVNLDRKAQVFDYADIGICGDCRVFLEGLQKTGRKL